MNQYVGNPIYQENCMALKIVPLRASALVEKKQVL